MATLSKSHVLEVVRTAWAAAHELAVTIPDEQWQSRMPSGSWRVADVFAHLAYWNARLPDDLAACLEDRREKESGFETNRRVAKERRDWTPDQIRAALREAEAVATQAIEAIPGDHARSSAALKLAHHEAAVHVQTHVAQVRGWRDGDMGGNS